MSLSWDTTGVVVRTVWSSEITAEGAAIDGVGPLFDTRALSSEGDSARELNMARLRRTTATKTARKTMVPRGPLPTAGRVPMNKKPPAGAGSDRTVHSCTSSLLYVSDNRN